MAAYVRSIPLLNKLCRKINHICLYWYSEIGVEQIIKPCEYIKYMLIHENNYNFNAILCDKIIDYVKSQFI